DHAALFLIMSAMAGAGIFLSGFKDLLAHQSRKRFYDLAAIQFLKAVMLCAVVYGVIKTGSRGGLHSLVLAASVLAFISTTFIKTKTSKYAARGLVALFIVGYGILLYNNRLLLGFDNGVLVGSVTVRFSLYQSGLEMFRDFPLFGAGLGAVEHAFPYYQLKNWGLVRHIHGDWLELFLQVGLLGGLIYLTGLMAALRKFFHIWTECPSFTVKSLYGGGLGALLAASLHNFVEFGSQMPANALVFYVLMGALASKPAVESLKFRYDAEEEEAETPLKRSIALPAAAAACLLMFFTISPAIGWWYDFIAKSAPYEKKVLYRAAALNWAPSPRYAFRLGADYYNRALKNKPEARDLYIKSLQSIETYLLRVPVNTDLTLLKKNLLIHLYVRPSNRPVSQRPGRPSAQFFNLSNP
ncbi:MAG: O-antigen ligase family protein, partial [Elusimicrobiota bacterium]|nr:O-antigen ligase family protein [Elusimicrobiota bacterium]